MQWGNKQAWSKQASKGMAMEAIYDDNNNNYDMTHPAIFAHPVLQEWCKSSLPSVFRESMPESDLHHMGDICLL